MRVLNDVLLGGCEAGAVLQCDDAVGLKQLQRSGLIGGIVRHCDLCTVLDVRKVSALAGIDAERLIVDGTHRYDMGVVLCIEIIKIRLVLEVVGLDLSVLYCQVRLYIVIVGNHLNVYALGCQGLLCGLENLSVGAGRCTDLDGYGLCVLLCSCCGLLACSGGLLSSGCGLCCCSCGGCGAAAAACQCACSQSGCQYQ